MLILQSNKMSLCGTSTTMKMNVLVCEGVLKLDFRDNIIEMDTMNILLFQKLQNLDLVEKILFLQCYLNLNLL